MARLHWFLLARLMTCAISASPTAEYNSASDLRIGIRTYSGYNRVYVSYTSRGTIVFEEKLYATLDVSGDMITNNLAATSSPFPTNSLTTATPTITKESNSSKSSVSSESITDRGTLSAPTCAPLETVYTKWANSKYDRISCCDDLHRLWSQSSSEYASPFDSSSLLYTTWEQPFSRSRPWTIAKCDGPFTTLCDGVARAMCSPATPQPAMVLRTGKATISSLTRAWPVVASQYPVPKPNCSISSSECTGLWDFLAGNMESYWKTNGLHDNWNTPSNDTQSEDLVEAEEPSGQNPHCSGSGSGACLVCGFHNETVQLLYWPMEADESHLCSKSSMMSSHFTPTSSQIMIASWKHFTLTSPTIYAYYTQMAEEGGCGSFHTDILVPIDPTEVSTMVYRSDSDPAPFVSRVDWRHFAYQTSGSYSWPLVPRSAYCGDQRQIYFDEKDPCNIIYHDWTPGLDIRLAPSVLGRIDPAWRYCRNYQQMAFDPPVALKPVAFLTTPVLALATGLNSLQYPPATQAGPFPTATALPKQSDGIADPAADTDPTASTDPPNFSPASVNDPKVYVSKISLLTIYATKAAMRTENENPASGSAGDKHQPTDPGYKPLPVGQGLGEEAVFAISGQRYTAQVLRSGDGFVVDGTTIAVGGDPVTLNGVSVTAIKGGIVIDAGHNNGRTGLSGDSNESTSGSSRGIQTGEADEMLEGFGAPGPHEQPLSDANGQFSSVSGAESISRGDAAGPHMGPLSDVNDLSSSINGAKSIFRVDAPSGTTKKKNDSGGRPNVIATMCTTSALWGFGLLWIL
ncbi:hypothetical protein EJ08DRAFT_737089 [Tothia fuscella]|uniref:Uncharacterized protein n=1 Tax=Tothia fuscella TaxID=1048955 RepID=A0A9P4NJS9_9PEZI|nr:hypothetical protein EJ08DRAFT_737089 [Tothia fuscella]